MSEAQETVAEEAFTFPRYAALINGNPSAATAYALGFVERVRDTRVVPVRVGPGHLDQTVVYEHQTRSKVVAAVLLRSAWLRPIGSRDDGIRPLRIQVLVDHVLVLDQELDDHVRQGHPLPRRPCSCNNWAGSGAECSCPTTTTHQKSFLLHATALSEDQHAVPTMPYGIFAPHGTLIQIRAVKPGRGAVDFQARCGITAALYSTSTKDMNV